MGVIRMALGVVGVAAGILTFYLRQERDDQPKLAAEIPLSSANPAPAPAPPQSTEAAPSESASQEAPPSALPPKTSDNEFKGALEKNPTLHSALWEAEVRDPIWAQAMEYGLRNYYSGMTDLVPHGMPTIECKKTVCEVLMSAPGMSFKEVLGDEEHTTIGSACRHSGDRRSFFEEGGRSGIHALCKVRANH
jgi:hypothetical protein